MLNLRNNVKVIEEEENYLVVYKPSCLPTVPLKNDTKLTLLEIVSETYADVTSFEGYSSWENGVLHRLDTKTSGIVLIARNKPSFDYFLNLQKTGVFKKEYLATSNIECKTIESFGDYPYQDPLYDGNGVCIKSYFRYYGKGRKMVLPVLDSYNMAALKKTTGTEYETFIKYEETVGTMQKFRCSLTAGFKHQVRSHMAWSGHPLIGDEIYGGIESEKFGLEAIKITFTDPKNNEEKTIEYKEK
jgi:23S rRNA pseudouridine1911/1915/1917 synthase